jgi:hypothetical protein
MSILPYIPLALQTLLFWVLVRGKWFRVFPWFFVYTTLSILITCLRFALRNHEVAYHYVYWATDGVYVVLGVAVLYEVFHHLFRKFAYSRWLHSIFPIFVLLTIVIAFPRTKQLLDGGDPIMQTVLAAELGVRFLQVLTFVLLLVLAALYALRWRQPAFGICAGYGIYASVNLLTTTKYYEFGTKFTYLWGWVSVITYTIAVLIWLLYFAAPIEEETLRGKGPPLSPQELERYKEIVRRVQRP